MLAPDGWDRLANVLVGHGNELNFFPSIVVRIVGRKITLIYVVKNYSDCCVRNRLRTANAKALSQNGRLLWRSGQEKMVAWAAAVALGRRRSGQ